MGRRQLSILVAESNRLLADALADLFSEINGGHPVLSAGTVGEALKIAARETPDLVLVDHWIGHDDVESTVREFLRRSPRSAIVIMTTNIDPAVNARLQAAGVRLCVEKDDVLRAARSILNSVDAP